MECLLLNKKYLVISHQDKNNYLSTRNLFRSFKHFDGVDKIKNISISKNKKDLTKLLMKVQVITVLLYHPKVIMSHY